MIALFRTMFIWPLLGVYLAWTVVVYLAALPLLMLHGLLGTLVAKVGGFTLEDPEPDFVVTSVVGDDS